ncbi:MAG: hypothetical protein NZ899_07860, partial [Thermoguttaceae bacterium]|nr:hypothetical protein [Thermoguttaceae bacterium]
QPTCFHKQAAMGFPSAQLALALAAIVAGLPSGAAESTAGMPSEQGEQAEIAVNFSLGSSASSFEWCDTYLLFAKSEGSSPGNAPSSLGPQVLVLKPAGEIVVALPPQGIVTVTLEAKGLHAKRLSFWSEPLCDLGGKIISEPAISVLTQIGPSPGTGGQPSVAPAGSPETSVVAEACTQRRRSWSLLFPELSDQRAPVPAVKLTSGQFPSAIRLGGFRVDDPPGQWTVSFHPQASPISFPPPGLPPYFPAIEAALVEWDWRLQDGIGTPREPATFEQAIGILLERMEKLVAYLGAASTERADLASVREDLTQFRRQLAAFAGSQQVSPLCWQAFWRQVHWWRRKVLFKELLPPETPLVFVKHIPSAFSHQLTQYYGRDARPGGGIFLLPRPGTSFLAVDLLRGRLPVGSYQHLDVAPSGEALAFAFCEVDKPPPDRETHSDRFFHLYELDLRGDKLRQLTSGPFDDFAPRYLPDGRVVFISTRRGGFHRCGRGPCPVYTLAIRQQDGTVEVISFHETHEWDPAVLPDGRILYTRWDYVDRHAVFYQQLWTIRPDGSNVQAYYGNGTFNPVGIWEAVPIPGSKRIMATAAAHHAMTAGSIILLDVLRGRDGPAAIERLTPDAPFPESEIPVLREPGGTWHMPVGVTRTGSLPIEARRWPGHCYRSPWPLTEDYFVCAYSYDSLIGEPTANPPNMFGLYLVDRFGNKELLYRDLNHSSLWPAMVAKRPTPPAVASVRFLGFEVPALRPPKTVGSPPDAGVADRTGENYPQGEQNNRRVSRLPQGAGPIGEGLFILQNVYDAWPPLPDVRITHLRIVQVLPKSTPHINTPPVGLANASPGKQVLGTVPVEADGSAFFMAPAGIPIAFQALDEKGQAVQIMRSVTYLQPGEVASCIGCHEPRHKAPAIGSLPLALRRGPSPITPGPKGSRPLSYPLLVQPILDRHCVRCHNDERADGGINLSGRPAGHFSVSYLALAPRVRISAWDGRPDFTKTNCEPYTVPDFFGARGSPLMKLLLSGHGDVTLSTEEIAALATWMDTNALFYGTFDPADQARQLRGEEIAGPAWQ